MDHVSWSLGLFPKNIFLEVGLNTKPGDRGTPNAQNSWWFLFYYAWGSRMNRKSFEIAFGWGPGHTWLHRARDHTTLLWKCVGTAFGHFLLGSHNFVVRALGSCVKWPLILGPHWALGMPTNCLPRPGAQPARKPRCGPWPSTNAGKDWCPFPTLLLTMPMPLKSKKKRLYIFQSLKKNLQFEFSRLTW